MFSKQQPAVSSRILLLCLWLTTVVSVVDGASYHRECGFNSGADDEECVQTFNDMSCRDFLREYSLSGSCCSLADHVPSKSAEDSEEGGTGRSGGLGCNLTVSGADVVIGEGEGGNFNVTSCTYNQRECPSCCSMDEDGSYFCVAPNQVYIASQFTQACPVSSYDPFPAEFPLNPFSVTVVVVADEDNEQGGDDVNSEDFCDDKELHASYRVTLETYLENTMGGEYAGILIKLGKPWPAFNRRRQRRLGTGSENVRERKRKGVRRIKCTLEFKGTAIISKTENVAIKMRTKGIVAAQVDALGEFRSAHEGVKRVDVHSQ